MTALILYSGRDGQTLAIASYIARKLQDRLTCEVIDLLNADGINLSKYQQVMVGASVRYGRFDSGLDKFVKHRAEQLNNIPSAFFAVNLTARKPEQCSPESNVYTRKFLIASPWRPKQCMVFAGALRYPRYRWFDRIMIQLIMYITGGETDARKEVEYTDWHQVERFAHDFSQI
ncbi:Protoporphyrinogen IX dehydrogenase [menaquinone] [Serratia symbiotica]|nr:Protoporphyrinogen IX dehydrogenase [menaquinone] [Serratia symbiotica]